MKNNKSHITAFSLNKNSERILNRLQEKTGKSRSQLLREIIESHSNRSREVASYPRSYSSSQFLRSPDPHSVLKNYYELISSQKPKPTLVIGVALIGKQKKVLIGLRKVKDTLIKNLSWSFPSCKFSSLNFETEMRKCILQETGVNAVVTSMVHCRLIPDSPDKKVRVVALYYHCRILSGKLSPGGDFREVKWVPAVDVTRHFTTSVSDEIINFLGSI